MNNKYFMGLYIYPLKPSTGPRQSRETIPFKGLLENRQEFISPLFVKGLKAIKIELLYSF
jgi:hypothetical protein